MKNVQHQLDDLFKRMAAIEEKLNSWGVSPPNPTRSIMDLKDIMLAKERVADEFKRHHASEVAMGLQWDTPENRAQYLKLRAEVRAINEKIASML